MFIVYDESVAHTHKFTSDIVDYPQTAFHIDSRQLYVVTLDVVGDKNRPSAILTIRDNRRFYANRQFFHLDAFFYDVGVSTVASTVASLYHCSHNISFLTKLSFRRKRVPVGVDASRIREFNYTTLKSQEISSSEGYKVRRKGTPSEGAILLIMIRISRNLACVGGKPVVIELRRAELLRLSSACVAWKLLLLSSAVAWKHWDYLAASGGIY